MCKYLVTPTAKVGAFNRNPEPRECTYKNWKDGLCKLHHPENIKRKEDEARSWDERIARQRALESKIVLTEESCIMYLVNLGYRIDKPNKSK